MIMYSIHSQHTLYSTHSLRLADDYYDDDDDGGGGGDDKPYNNVQQQIAGNDKGLEVCGRTSNWNM